ncbi:MAG: hypothetical protein ABFS45_24730 [Pseudomonadota bacterium]
MWKVKSNRQIREERQMRKQEIEVYEPSIVYNIVGHMIFWTVMILVGFILGLIWAAMENK